MGNPVLAAEEDALEVDVLDPLPRLHRRVQHRGVVGRADPRVVEEDVDAAELVLRPGVHVPDLVGVRDVGLDRQVALRPRVEVDADDARALSLEQPGGPGADPARRAGDHADLAVEPPHQFSSVA
jgi:hypothetical protein